MLTTPAQKFRQAIPTASLSHLQRLAAKLTDIRNVDPSSRQTSLQLAVLHGRQDVVEWLVLDEGHDDGEISRDTLGETCCHIAAAAGHVGILELYVSQYPFVLAWVNSKGGTALHLAAMKGQLEAAHFLLESGADIDAPDLQGNTPLHYASSYDKLSLIRLLVESDCQSDQRNNEGFTASDYSYSFSCQRALEESIRIHNDNLKQVKKNQKTSSKASPRIPRTVRVDTVPARSSTPQPQTPEEMTPTARDRDEFGLGFAYNASRPGSIHHSSPSMPSSVPLSPSNSAQGTLKHMTPPPTAHGPVGSSNLSPNRPKPQSLSPTSPLSLRATGRSTSSTSQLGPPDDAITPPTHHTHDGGALIRPSLNTRGSPNLLRRGTSRSSSFSSMTTVPAPSINSVTAQSQSPSHSRSDRSRSESNTSSLMSSGGDSTTSSAVATVATPSSGPASAYRSRSTSNLSSEPSRSSRSRSGSSALPPPPLDSSLSNRDVPVAGTLSHSSPPPTPPSATTKPTAPPGSNTSTLMSKGPSLTGSDGTKNSRAGSTIGEERKEKEKERGRSASNESHISGGRVARVFGLGKRS